VSDRIPLLLTLLAFLAPSVAAHPQVQHALDLVIAPDRVTVTARIDPEEIQLLGQAATPHGPYVLRHLHLRAGGRELTGRITSTTGATYALEYPLPSRPAVVRLDQDFLIDREGWSALCVVKVRQIDQPEFQSAVLTRDRSIEFGCDWPGAPADAPKTGTPWGAPAMAVIAALVAAAVVFGWVRVVKGR
jgi:hypothetical protein